MNKLTTKEQTLLAIGGAILLAGIYRLIRKPPHQFTMTGSEFVRQYANKGLGAWEAAALEAAREGNLTPREWVPIRLSDGQNEATIQVQEDVLAIGPKEDSVRLPLTPGGAQNIFNLFGWLLPTPWISYQQWRNSPIKLSPTAIPALGEQNKGADLNQYYKHSQYLDRQIAGVLASTQNRVSGPEMVAGSKKHVVVSNIYQPGKVLIFGWYRPSPDVFDDGTSMSNPNRQPIQPKSNVHGSGYVDYSHGILAVHPVAMVNGQQMNTVDLYQHPTLSRLVSNEGPIKIPRYPSQIPVAGYRPASVASFNVIPDYAPTTPPLSEYALAQIAAQFSRGDRR